MALTRIMKRRRSEDVWKGLAAGAIGGLAAAWVMNQLETLWSDLSLDKESSHGAQSIKESGPGDGSRRGRENQQGSDREGDDATEKLASAISENVAGRALTKSERRAAGTAIHYAFGATTGAMYGAMAELSPRVTVGAGMPFGAAVWLAADEGMVPAMGLSKPPTEYSLLVHACNLASHVAYGATTEVLRRAVRAII